MIKIHNEKNNYNYEFNNIPYPTFNGQHNFTYIYIGLSVKKNKKNIYCIQLTSLVYFMGIHITNEIYQQFYITCLRH